MQDHVDLLIMTIWWYGNGYLFAWFFTLLALDPHRTGSLFGLIGLILGALGIEIRGKTGRFPFGLMVTIWPLPFFCSILGVGWWVVETVQRWLGMP